NNDNNDESKPTPQIPINLVLESLENIKLLLLNPPETLCIKNEDSKVINSLKKHI
ncbi:41190_t:CDS:1, partial [Gigaspora margarita]